MSRRKVRVAHLLKILKANETFLKSLSGGQRDWQNLTLFIDALKPYGRLTLDDLSLILQETTKRSEVHANSERREFLNKAGLSQLRDPGFRLLLSREELSELAQRELGISKWKLMKTSRKEMEKVLQNALENVETLDTIARRASSKE
jgi:hypothetical protein